ncbi:hypothetical protein D3Z36_09190 [Lachnospiraceae bacterium]|nr:hypothetical protein [Lachnospiraceae bacterium]
MKSRWMGIIAVLCIWMVFAQPVKAESYEYDSIGNVYTIKATGGNITNAVNAALDAMNTTSANRGTLVIQPGDYSVNLIMLDKSYVTIKAKGATLKFMGSSMNGQYLVKCTNQSTTGVVIDGGTWDGNKKASYIFNFSSNSSPAKNLTVQNCTMKNAKDSNIRVDGGKEVVLDNITSTGSKYGIDIKRSSGVTVKNSSVYSCEAGIDMRSMVGTENIIEDCNVYKCSKVGMQIKDAPTVVTAKGGSCSDNYAGISLTTGAKMNLKGIAVCNNKSNGISPVGSKKKRTVLNISDSSFNNNGRHGVAAALYVDLTANNSEMNGNASNGVMMRDYCTSKGLTNLVTNSNKANGILINDGSTCKMISGCTALKNKANGFMLQDVSVKLERVNASDNKNCGVYVSAKAKKTITVKNSTMKKNVNNGMYVCEKAGYIVSGTRIQNNKKSGIDSNGGFIILNGTGNNISGNKKYGVCMRGLKGQKGDMRITRGTISGNKNAGVYFYGDVTGFCNHAVIKGNLTGITVAEGAHVSKINSNTIQDHTQFGIAVYKSAGGKTTVMGQCTGNKLSNPKAANEIKFWPGTRVPSKLKITEPLTIDKNVISGKKKVTGKVPSGYKVTVTANGRKINAKQASSNGVYSVTVPALKSGKNVEVMITDSYKNKIFTVKKL